MSAGEGWDDGARVVLPELRPGEGLGRWAGRADEAGADGRGALKRAEFGFSLRCRMAGRCGVFRRRGGKPGNALKSGGSSTFPAAWWGRKRKPPPGLPPGGGEENEVLTRLWKDSEAFQVGR